MTQEANTPNQDPGDHSSNSAVHPVYEEAKHTGQLLLFPSEYKPHSLKRRVLIAGRLAERADRYRTDLRPPSPRLEPSDPSLPAKMPYMPPEQPTESDLVRQAYIAIEPFE